MSLPPPPNPSKRPIPRLGPPSQLSSRQAANRQRVSRACVSCRTRKVKCDSDQPSCKTCRDQSLTCVYTGSRKDRLKDAANCNQRMAGLLKELRAHAGDAKQHEIDDLLDQVAQNNADALMSIRSLARSTHVQFTDPRAAGPSTQQGSEDDDIDSTDQDMLDSYSPPAIGHLGKHSDIHLLRRLHQSSVNAQIAQPPRGMSRTSSDEVVTPRQTTDYNFHLDDEELELDMFVDPFQLPPYDVARTLLDGYMDTVQDNFPILNKAALVADISLFYNSLSSPVPLVLSEKTRAIWNLVFAIGAVCTRRIMPEPPPCATLDHIVYHSRACILTQRGPWWCLQFDLPHVQMMGLFSLYYLAVARINRSWLASGMAMRSGYALGLHLRNTEPTVPAVEKEVRTRIWWGLYALETTLCAITGRSSAGAEQYFSVSMPLPLPVHGLEESDVTLQHAQLRIRRNSSSQSTTEPVSENRFPECSPQEHEPLNCGSYLKSTARLNMITTAALSQLYSANSATKQRESFQASIAQLLGRIEACMSTLPNGLDVRALNPTTTLSREQISLALQYYSTVILISRPCLYRFVRQTSSWTPAEGEFTMKTAQVCIRAAKAIANLLPNILRHIDGDVTQSWYRKSPWWSMVHFIMQATTTLLLELCYTTVETLSDREETIACLKRLIRGLQGMELSNDSAKRAYIIAFNVFQSIARNVSVDISDLQNEVAAHFEHQRPHFEFHPGLQHLDVREQMPSGIYGHGVPGADIEHLAWEQGAVTQGFTGLLTQMNQHHAPPHPPTFDEQMLLSPDADVESREMFPQAPTLLMGSMNLNLPGQDEQSGRA